MARPFLTDEAKAAFTGAIGTVESQSSAELVVAVRPRSAAYLEAAFGAALAAVFVTLALLLFTPWDFGLAWFLIDPALAAVLAGLLVWNVPALTRLLTRRPKRRQRVEEVARALFVDKRIHQTSGRTGILFYVSVLEREAILVPDVAVEPFTLDAAAEAGDGWRRVVGRIDEALGRGAAGAEIAALLAGLGEVLQGPLPRLEGDVDELPNEVM
jgi:putative membrane protein